MLSKDATCDHPSLSSLLESVGKTRWKGKKLRGMDGMLGLIGFKI
jgi:hypothetical protein